MKYIIILLFSLFHDYHLLCQSKDYTHDYFPLINKAELNIIKQRFDSSLIFYSQAFSNVNSGFSRDYFNASVCAIKLKKYKIAYQFLDSLVILGTTKKFFQTIKVFEPLRKDRYWDKFINDFERKQNSALFNNQKRYKQLLLGIEFADQQFRKLTNAYDLYRDTINKIDVANVSIYLKCIKEMGFPSEKLIGIDNPFIADNLGFIVILHQYQKKSKGIQNFDFSEVLINALKKGEFSPHRFAYLYSQYDDAYYSGTGVGKIQFDTLEMLVVSRFSPEKKIEINKRRIEIGLETLEEFKLKAKFIAEQSNFEFSFQSYECISIYNLPSQKAFDHFLKFKEPLADKVE